MSASLGLPFSSPSSARKSSRCSKRFFRFMRLVAGLRDVILASGRNHSRGGPQKVTRHSGARQSANRRRRGLSNTLSARGHGYVLKREDSRRQQHTQRQRERSHLRPDHRRPRCTIDALAPAAVSNTHKFVVCPQNNDRYKVSSSFEIFFRDNIVSLRIDACYTSNSFTAPFLFLPPMNHEYNDHA